MVVSRYPLPIIPEVDEGLGTPLDCVVCERAPVYPSAKALECLKEGILFLTHLINELADFKSKSFTLRDSNTFEKQLAKAIAKIQFVVYQVLFHSKKAMSFDRAFLLSPLSFTRNSLLPRCLSLAEYDKDLIQLAKIEASFRELYFNLQFMDDFASGTTGRIVLPKHFIRIATDRLSGKSLEKKTRLGRGGFSQVYSAESFPDFAMKQTISRFIGDSLMHREREHHFSLILENANGVVTSQYILFNIIGAPVAVFPRGAETLEKICGTILTPNKIQNIFCEILKGVRSLHEKGLVHRDLRLPNILRMPGGFSVADLGAVKKNGQTSFCVPYYAPPEFSSKFTLTDKVDMWQIGLLVFYLVTGKAFQSSLKRELVETGRVSSRINLMTFEGMMLVMDLLKAYPRILPKLIEKKLFPFISDEFPTTHPIFKLIRGCLKLEKEARLSAAQAFDLVNSS